MQMKCPPPVYTHSEARGQGPPTPVISFWCFAPGLAMQDLLEQGVGSVILTSGSLAPLESFACELQMTFNIRLENPHVIKPQQVWAGVVQQGPMGHKLNSSFKVGMWKCTRATRSFEIHGQDALFFSSLWTCFHCSASTNNFVHLKIRRRNNASNKSTRSSNNSTRSSKYNNKLCKQKNKLCRHIRPATPPSTSAISA